MGIFRALCGSDLVQVSGADVFGTLAAVENRGIVLELVEKVDDLTLQFWISRRDLQVLEKICAKKGDDLRVLQSMGWHRSAGILLRRPVLWIGCILLTIFTFWAQSRVFFVFVEGNEQIPANFVLEKAAECGISFGTSARAIRSESLKNEMLSKIPGLEWVGINTSGCVAVISVRERTASEQNENAGSVSSMVAVCDGLITEVTVTEGFGLCGVGDTVRAGQVLISGYTDCGICIRAGNASGEIFAQTAHRISAVMPTKGLVRGEKVAEVKKYSLLIGKNRINLQNSSGISGGECVRIYVEQYLTLPGGFRLPFGIAVERYISYDIQWGEIAGTENQMLPVMESTLRSKMIAGRILTSSCTNFSSEEVCRLEAVYGCHEMIGRVRPEECLPEYENRGKNCERGAGG